MKHPFEGWTNTFREGCNASNWLQIGTCKPDQVFALKEVYICLDDERCLRAFLKYNRGENTYQILDLYGLTRIKWNGTHTFPAPSDQVLQIYIYALSPETHYEGCVEIDRVIGSP